MASRRPEPAVAGETALAETSTRDQSALAPVLVWDVDSQPDPEHLGDSEGGAEDVIEKMVSFAPGDPETLVIDTSKLRVLQIDGVKYSAELFRTFGAPDPKKFFQLRRDGDNVIVTDVSGDLRELLYAARAARDWMCGALSMRFGEWIDPVTIEMLEVSLEKYQGVEGSIPIPHREPKT